MFRIEYIFSLRKMLTSIEAASCTSCRRTSTNIYYTSTTRSCTEIIYVLYFFLNDRKRLCTTQGWRSHASRVLTSFLLPIYSWNTPYMYLSYTFLILPRTSRLLPCTPRKLWSIWSIALSALGTTSFVILLTMQQLTF